MSTGKDMVTTLAITSGAFMDEANCAGGMGWYMT